jgi:hypothetical protein
MMMGNREGWSMEVQKAGLLETNEVLPSHRYPAYRFPQPWSGTLQEP